MTQQPDFDIQAPRIDRTAAPTKGLPVRPYIYRGNEPWIPKKSR